MDRSLLKIAAHHGTDHFYTKIFAPGMYGYTLENVLGYIYP